MILSFKILHCQHFIGIMILINCLIIKINAFFLRIYYFRCMIQIEIHFVFIDRVHFETTLIKCYIFRTVVDCVFFFYLQYLAFLWCFHYWVVLGIFFWNCIITCFSCLHNFRILVIFIIILIFNSLIIWYKINIFLLANVIINITLWILIFY